MTDPDEYRNNRAMYEDGDTTAMVKCVTCGEMVPEDEATEFVKEQYCQDCAESNWLRRCAWCGEWGIWKKMAHGGDTNWYHPTCLKESDKMAHGK